MSTDPSLFALSPRIRAEIVKSREFHTIQYTKLQIRQQIDS